LLGALCGNVTVPIGVIGGVRMKLQVFCFDRPQSDACFIKAYPALGAPMSTAWVHGSPHVENLALPKSLKSCNFTLAKAVSGGCRIKSRRLLSQKL
jgi:hypothetical protein